MPLFPLYPFVFNFTIGIFYIIILKYCLFLFLLLFERKEPCIKQSLVERPTNLKSKSINGESYSSSFGADILAGVAANTQEERVAAQMALAEVPLKRFLEEELIPYEKDEVTRLILDSHNKEAFQPIANLTVGEFREYLLSENTTTEILQRIKDGITPENDCCGF